MVSAGLREFKKLVYESKFTKCAEGMSFVNWQQAEMGGQ
jgi:hypothetical protein